MRGNLPVPSARQARAGKPYGSHRDCCVVAALFPAVGRYEGFLPATLCTVENKAATGWNPVAPATFAKR